MYQSIQESSIFIKESNAHVSWSKERQIEITKIYWDLISHQIHHIAFMFWQTTFPIDRVLSSYFFVLHRLHI